MPVYCRKYGPTIWLPYARGERLPDGGAQAISGIGKDAAEAHAGCAAPVNLGQRDLGFGPGAAMIFQGC